jgi:hypothetical protein
LKHVHIYLPFQLSEGRELADLPWSGVIDGFEAELKNNQPYYGLLVKNVVEAQATTTLERLSQAIKWFALEIRAGVITSVDTQAVHYPNDPIQAGKNIFGEISSRHVDVAIDGCRAAVWDCKKIAPAYMMGQPARLVMGYRAKKFAELIEEGMILPSFETRADRDKLELAIELYCLAHFKSTDFAKFLVLCTVLEAGAPAPTVANHCVEMLEMWIKQAKLELDQTNQGTPKQDQLLALTRRLENLKQQSHTSRIRDYVWTKLTRDGHPDADVLARDVVKLYGRRGRLVHHGDFNVGDATARLEDIVRKTLKAAMRWA